MDDVTAALPAAGAPTLFRVDDLVVDLGRRSVMRAGVDLKLPGLTFDLFVELVRAAPNVVTVFDAGLSGDAVELRLREAGHPDGVVHLTVGVGRDARLGAGLARLPLPPCARAKRPPVDP